MKLLRYLNNDLIDLCLLILFIILLVKSILEHFNTYIITGIVFVIVYILGVMWRMGGAKDLMNEMVTQYDYRITLGLSPAWEMRHAKPTRDRDVIGMIFRYGFLLAWTVTLIYSLLW